MSLDTRKHLDKIYDEVEYLPHQLEDTRDIARRTSVLLGSEMGTMKSLIALTVGAIDFERGWAKRILIVCPATLKGNWEEEIDTFTTFTHKTLSAGKGQEELLDTFDADILITGFEMVVKHIDRINAMGFDILICDEAHEMRNRTAKRTKAFLKLNCPRSLLLTGSPVLNRADELWPLLHRINPAEFPSYWNFVYRFAVYGGYNNKQIVGLKNKAELQEILDRYMIRRYKADVLGLPDKQIIPVYVDFLPDQRKIYDDALSDILLGGDGTTPMEMENILVKMLRLKQICGTPTAIDPGLPDHSAKLDRAVEMIEEICLTEKVVVYTQFRGVQAALARRLAVRGTHAYQLHGDVPQPKRMPVIHEWTRDPIPRPMIVMYQVGGVGLNLIAARKGIALDKLYVPKLNEQAYDRMHRYGASKTQPVQIFEIIMRKSIEQRIEKILKSKSKLFRDLVDASDFRRALYTALMEPDDD